MNVPFIPKHVVNNEHVKSHGISGNKKKRKRLNMIVLPKTLTSSLNIN